MAALTEQQPGAGIYVWLLLPVSVVASRVIPERQHWTFAGAAFVTASVTAGDASYYLWPGLAALVFASVVTDPADPPWLGWAAGSLGAVVSLFIGSTQDPTAFAGVILGGGFATLVRLRERADSLTEEATELRIEHVWLEQRTTLARELHDVVGHHVTAMVVQAEAGQLGDRDGALRTIADLGRTALGELDALVVHLRDPDAAITLSAPPRLQDIDELLAEPLRQQGVAVTVSVAPDLELDETQVLGLYRIAQESLTNVARHAGARHTWVELGPSGDREIRLRVSDDGAGPPESVERGSGLLGIHERAAALGGRWDLSARPGGGTMLDVVVPVTRG